MTDLRCPEDGRPMVMRTGKHGRFLACERWPLCDVTHGVHPNGKPMGVPASKRVRTARVEAHAAFDKFWRDRGWRRKRAYEWLEKMMGTPAEHAHIASFNYNQCHALIALVRDAEAIT